MPISSGGAGTAGSTAGAIIVRGPFSFTFATAGLTSGVAFYTPTVGDMLVHAWVVVDTAWDGTTPSADIGTFVGSTTGLLKGETGNVWGMNFAWDTTYSGGTGLIAPTSSSTTDVIESFNGGGLPFTATNPLKVVVSQTGAVGGASPGATQGSARIYIATVTPTAL